MIIILSLLRVHVVTFVFKKKLKKYSYAMFGITAYVHNQNKQFMRLSRRVLRDNLDPFDIPDER